MAWKYAPEVVWRRLHPPYVASVAWMLCCGSRKDEIPRHAPLSVLASP